MADHNPWATNESQSSPWQNSNQYSQQQQPQQQQTHQSDGYQQRRFYDEQQSHQSQQQYSQPHQQQNPSSAQDYYNPPPQQQQPDFNAWTDAQGNPPPQLPARNPAHNMSNPPSFPRHDTDEVLASQPDRAEQVEHLQAYEATANLSVDDRNRLQLEKEFPNIDGSLIAALYGDTKDLSATRELLQELGRE